MLKFSKAPRAKALRRKTHDEKSSLLVRQGLDEAAVYTATDGGYGEAPRRFAT